MEASNQPARRATVVPFIALLGRHGRDTGVTTGTSRATDHLCLSRCTESTNGPRQGALQPFPGLRVNGGLLLGLELFYDLCPNRPDLVQPSRFVRHGLRSFDGYVLVNHVAFHDLER